MNEYEKSAFTPSSRVAKLTWKQLCPPNKCYGHLRFLDGDTVSFSPYFPLLRFLSTSTELFYLSQRANTAYRFWGLFGAVDFNG